MKHKSFTSRSPSSKFPIETISDRIFDQSSKYQLPRHISAIETQSHRGGNNLSHNFPLTQPRLCQIYAHQPAIANPALEMLNYQLSDRRARQKHLENLRSSLNHRLQVAQAQGNDRLITILQDEYQQLNLT